MAGAFQQGAFQNNAFQCDPLGVSTVLMPGKSGPSGGSFSRKRFKEIQAAYRAAEDAERKALELKTKQRESLQKAAQAVERAAREAEEQESAVDLTGMVAALEAATNATRATAIIKNAKAAYDAAMIALDLEDEEEAIMLLPH